MKQSPSPAGKVIGAVVGGLVGNYAGATLGMVVVGLMSGKSEPTIVAKALLFVIWGAVAIGGGFLGFFIGSRPVVAWWSLGTALGLGFVTLVGGIAISHHGKGPALMMVFIAPVGFAVGAVLGMCIGLMHCGRYTSRETRLRADWEQALSDIKNPAILAFFEKEIRSGQECNLEKRYLRYEDGPNQQWFLVARPRNVFALQQSRFQGDVEFWRGGLSRPDEIKPVRNDTCLRFLLITKQDFQFFRRAWNEKLTRVKWLENRPANRAAYGDGDQVSEAAQGR